MLNRDAWREVPELVTKLVQDVVAGTGAEVEVNYTRGVPPVINDRLATAIIAGAAGAALGPDRVVEAEISMGGEDFAFYLEQVPGAMIRLGVGVPGADEVRHPPVGVRRRRARHRLRRPRHGAHGAGRAGRRRVLTFRPRGALDAFLAGSSAGPAHATSRRGRRRRGQRPRPDDQQPRQQRTQHGQHDLEGGDERVPAALEPGQEAGLGRRPSRRRAAPGRAGSR